MKVGLFITTQLHDITQAGYQVNFVPSEQGTVKVEILKPGSPDFYDAITCGSQKDPSRLRLEEDLIKALHEFRTIFSIPNARITHEATDTGSEPKDGKESDDSDQRDEELDNTGALA